MRFLPTSAEELEAIEQAICEGRSGLEGKVWTDGIRFGELVTKVLRGSAGESVKGQHRSWGEWSETLAGEERFAGCSSDIGPRLKEPRSRPIGGSTHEDKDRPRIEAVDTGSIRGGRHSYLQKCHTLTFKDTVIGNSFHLRCHFRCHFRRHFRRHFETFPTTPFSPGKFCVISLVLLLSFC